MYSVRELHGHRSRQYVSVAVCYFYSAFVRGTLDHTNKSTTYAKDARALMQQKSAVKHRRISKLKRIATYQGLPLQRSDLELPGKQYVAKPQQFFAFAFPEEWRLPATLQQVHPCRRPLPAKRESSSLLGDLRSSRRPRTHELRRRNRELRVAAYSRNFRQYARARSCVDTPSM